MYGTLRASTQGLQPCHTFPGLTESLEPHFSQSAGMAHLSSLKAFEGFSSSMFQNRPHSSQKTNSSAQELHG